ncbi:hypothetical protein DYB34_010285 [Aphanomyces astaci]|uniref:PDZ domain-containing protein n=2 Tax=Aphanomyces astaci TaxID=112090 RepID=A0A418C931_APHAT|nr:hypothetical protein DYB34_010285 [Aphanomyces astaci]
MSDGGVRGVLVAHSDATMYGLKFSGSKKLALVTVEQALRARRIQLDGCSITLEDRGTGILRTLQGPTDLSSSPSTAGTCVVEWTTATTPPSEVPFTDVLDHVVDAFLGVSLQKTYDQPNVFYTVTLTKAVVHAGALHYEATIDDGDVDFLSKEDVLQAMDLHDVREVAVPCEDVATPPSTDTPLPPSPASPPSEDRSPPDDTLVHVYFHRQSLHMTLGPTPTANSVCVYKLLRTADGSQGEASATGLVDIGDIIVQVNGVSVDGLSVDHIATIISQSPRPIQLSFQKKRDPGRSFPDIESSPTPSAPSMVPCGAPTKPPLDGLLAGGTKPITNRNLLTVKPLKEVGHNMGGQHEVKGENTVGAGRLLPTAESPISNQDQRRRPAKKQRRQAASIPITLRWGATKNHQV